MESPTKDPPETLGTSLHPEQVADEAAGTTPASEGADGPSPGRRMSWMRKAVASVAARLAAGASMAIGVALSWHWFDTFAKGMPRWLIAIVAAVLTADAILEGLRGEPLTWGDLLPPRAADRLARFSVTRLSRTARLVAAISGILAVCIALAAGERGSGVLWAGAVVLAVLGVAVTVAVVLSTMHEEAQALQHRPHSLSARAAERPLSHTGTSASATHPAAAAGQAEAILPPAPPAQDAGSA